MPHYQVSKVNGNGKANYRRLIEACKRKNLPTIKSILAEQPELANHRDKQNRTLLHYAVILMLDNDNDIVVAAAAAANDETHQRHNGHKDNSLQGDTLHCIECFNYLTSRCDIKLWWQQDSDGLSVLHMAVISSNVPMVEHIIYEHPYAIKYPLVSMRDHEHHSPLHWAVITNNLDTVRLLVNYAGTKLAHEPDLNGATPLHYATQTSDYPRYRQQLLGMLRSVGSGSGDLGDPLSKEGVNRDNDNKGATGKASLCQQEMSNEDSHIQRSSTTTTTKPPKKMDGSRTGTGTGRGSSGDGGGGQPKSFEILEYLVRLPQINLECADKDQRTPLLWAASSGNCGAIELLLAYGANANCFDANRLGGLHCAASHGYTDCLESLLMAPAEPYQQQLQQQQQQQQHNNPVRWSKVDANQVDNLNCTPLFYGVLSGNVDCVETLLDHGAHSDWQDSKGRTAAHFAALKGQLGALKLLQERGANLWLANKQGDLPLHYAIKSGRLQVVRWLLERSPYERAVNAINNFGRSPIHLATMRNNVQLVEYLIRCGANLNQLVKMRTKQSAALKTSGPGQAQGGEDDPAIQQQQQQQVPIVVRGNGKNQIVYHYETAVDMAKRLGNNECLQLLEQNQAKPASQVISSRQQQHQRGSLVGPNDSARSLFDIQSVEGPSPIGFETSCSSASPNMAMGLGASMAASEGKHSVSKQVNGGGGGGGDDGCKVPKLRRPAPDSLPCTDSTASSALSQNSLTSVRGDHHQQQQAIDKDDNQPEVVCGDQQCARNNDATRADSKGCPKGGGSARPYRGGISYNNEHICASIKCKLYDRNTARCSGCSTKSSAGGDWQLPAADDGGGGEQRQQEAAGLPHSAPTVRSCWRPGGQEIVTNVNVYTSPCAHCMLNQTQLLERRRCLECHQDGQHPKASARHQASHRNSTSSMEAHLQKGPQPMANRHVACPADDDDETTDGPSGGSEDGDDEGQADRSSRLPSLVGSTTSNQGFVRLRYLPPSQVHEQHLPVILSDREQSTSATSNEQAEGDDEELEAAAAAAEVVGNEQTQGNQVEGCHNKDGPISRRQLVSPAFEEPRFDKSQLQQQQPITASSSAATTRVAGRSHDRYINQARSPVAEYIRGGPSTIQQQQFHRPEVAASLRGGKRMSGGGQPLPSVGTRASSNRRMPDFSQVKPKVDSNRMQADDLDHHQEPSRSKSMSMLSHHHQHQDDSPAHRLSTTTITSQASPTMHQQHYKQSPAHHQQPPRSELGSRSVSRQTIIKTRRLSVDSVELATRVEKAIRKYRFETKLFEELQNLKRSQIRSGRANEAVLVKRLVEHLRLETRDLIGLDSYNGPYTYKAYERFLYDQLRKLSQSNCAKLSRHQPPYRDLMADGEDDHHHHYHQHPHDFEGDEDSELMMTNHHQYLDDDLRADMELRQIIGDQEEDGMDHIPHGPSDTGNDSDTVESFVLEPSGALEEIRVKGDVNEDKRKRKYREEAGSSQKEVMHIIHTTSGEGTSEKFLADTEPSETQQRLQASSDKGSEADGGGSLESTTDPEEIERQTRREMAESDIEEEAKSMSSAIIVDALGNVLRVGSPNDLNRLSGEQADRVEAEAEVQEMQGSDEGKVVGEQHETTGSSGVEPALLMANDDDAQQQQQQLNKSRRRSIVNIGNKMECIYHDVGIEIDPAPEMDEPDDPVARDEEGTQKESEADGGDGKEDEGEERKKVDFKSEDDGMGSPSARRLADVAEESQEQQQAEEPTLSNDLGPDKSEMIQQESEVPATSDVVDDKGSEIFNTDEKLDTTPGDHHQAPPAASAASGVTRRASSPTATTTTSRSSRREPKRFSRGSSLAETPPATPTQTKARVFNGHDLDALHQERSRSRGASSSKEKTTGQAVELSAVGEKADAGNNLALDDELRQPKDLADNSSGEMGQEDDRGSLNQEGQPVGDSTSGRKQQQLQVGSSDDDGAKRLDPVGDGRSRRRTVRKRLARSRLKPASKYQPRVPSDEEIKQRWSQIKARERSKKLSLVDTGVVRKRADSSAGGGEVEFVGADGGKNNHESNGLVTALHHHGGDATCLQAARSQPDLKGIRQLEGDSSTRETDLQSAELYTLLYEINEAMRVRSVVFADGDGEGAKLKGFGGASSRGGGKVSRQHQWCQRMAAQIVDVRTVKRTLSLPEAVMYSNDLLKRFNILKL